MRVALLCVTLCLPGAVLAQSSEGPSEVDEALGWQLDELRAEVAAEIQLHAYDLLDELVFGWTQRPVFATETPVILAGVTVPMGLGSGLQALVENHFAGLLIKNRSTKMVLAHCPQCTAVVVHSGAKGTLISRGVDAPEALNQLGGLSGARHAVFLDFEAEGAALVLRTRITALEPALPIVYARTMSSASSSGALLRAGDDLKSAGDARQEYLDALAGRGMFLIPLRIVVRTYRGTDQSPVAAAPYLWLQAGVEGALSQARAWTGTLSLGYTWTPELHDGWMAQARIARLLSGKVRSLTQPDLYMFVAGSAISVHGRDAIIFRDRVPNVNDIIADANAKKPRATFAAWQVGVELRVKNRIGAAAFLETLPTLYDAPALGSYLDVGVKFHTIGAEVSFCF